MARNFYVEKLGFPIVEEHPQSFAFRAGAVRFTVVPGGDKVDEESDVNPPATIMFRTQDIDLTVSQLRSKGISFSGEINTAPMFMRYITLLDPDNNVLHIAEYLRDPLLTE